MRSNGCWRFSRGNSSVPTHTLAEVAVDEYGPVDWNAIVAKE